MHVGFFPGSVLEVQRLVAFDAGSGVVQVWYPDELQGPPDSAQAQLKHVIWTCLRSRPDDRPTASQVQAALHKIMQQFA